MTTNDTQNDRAMIAPELLGMDTAVAGCTWPRDTGGGLLET